MTNNLHDPLIDPTPIVKCGTCRDWRHDIGTFGECWSADRLDGDLSKGPASETFSFQRCEAHRPYGERAQDERSRKLDAIWTATHADYKGFHNDERSILTLREGTCLVLLRNLTDAEIEKHLPATARGVL